LERQLISSGAPWEAIAGYSRAVRVGPMIHVAGTTSSDREGRVVGKGDAYAQTRHILMIIEAAIKEAGASLQDVVRTRMYVSDMAVWEEVARAHGEVFRDIRPAATLIEVGRLIGPDFLVEIEADAFAVS